jgi:hypothetical protein
MNKAYIDVPGRGESNASLVYIPIRGELFYNLLMTKFPEDSMLREVWDYIWTDGANLKDKYVVWLTNDYTHDELIDDLSLLDFHVVKLPNTFHRLSEMIIYIEENNI